MQTQNKIFDDLSRVASGALGALSGVKEEIEQVVRQQIERMVAEMDLVQRDEFEAVKAMAAEARDRQEELEKKVAALEAELQKAKAPAARSRTAKTAKKG